MEPTRDEVLISRVLDARSGSGDWRELELMAEQDPTLWRDLGASLRAEIAVRNAGEEVLDGTRRIDLPFAANDTVRSTPSRIWRHGVTGSGWLAAIVLLCVWLSTGVGAGKDAAAPLPGGDTLTTNKLATNTLNTTTTFDDALTSYRTVGFEEGRLVDELPMMVVDTQVLESGNDQMEVLYLRRFLERATVNGVYEVGRRDDGTAVPVPVHFTKRTNHGSL
ncbi:MAG: hypothetical protein AAF581_02135 [Planctomycetota bacterium]